MKHKIRVLVVGTGNMGKSHARAYHKLPGFDLIGLVNRSPESRESISEELGGIRQFDDFDTALAATKPEAVCIATYPDTHAKFALKSIEAGAHVFTEKPLAEAVEEAEEVVNLARLKKKKLVVGYILRVHPSWTKFIEIARTLGKPLVMRMNLNQQSKEDTWSWHLNLMETMSPIVDCGVHYVDVMCQMTRSRPIKVHAMGARLSEQLKPDMYNYGQLQVFFEDGSIGWYEAGWGPSMSETAYFVKDVIGPNGCVSIMDADKSGKSDDIDGHTKTNRLKVHHAEINDNNELIHSDEIINTEDEPDHQQLCDLEQEFFYDAIVNDKDLWAHQEDAVNSLRIVLAADQSVRTGNIITL